MTSHIVAIVGMRTTQVRYIANGKELPEELRGQIHGASHASESEQRP
jgi:hypothetical protein